MTNESLDYVIPNWTPPWLDNGKRLQQIVTDLQVFDQLDYWVAVMSIMYLHLGEDLLRLKDLNNEIANLEKEI